MHLNCPGKEEQMNDERKAFLDSWHVQPLVSSEHLWFYFIFRCVLNTSHLDELSLAGVFCNSIDYRIRHSIGKTDKIKGFRAKIINYVGVRIYQGIRMIKRSKMCPLGGATFLDNLLPAVTTILTPILVCLKPKILPIRWCHFL